MSDWLAYHSTNEANMVDAWLAGLRMTGIEIENYKQMLELWEIDPALASRVNIIN